MSWLTDINQRVEDILVPNDLFHSTVTHTDNDFVENHPRFAKRNDVVSYRRVVGDIRFALYNTFPLEFRSGNDYLVEYGLAFVPGTYDNAGVWSPGDYPDPRETGDEDEKWIFKNRAFLSFGYNNVLSFVNEDPSSSPAWPNVDNANNNSQLVQTAAPSLGYFVNLATQQTRPHMLSTDEQLPSGSKVDIQTRRKAEYGEKLHLLAYVTTEAPDTDHVDIFCNYQLRVLVNG